MCKLVKECIFSPSFHSWSKSGRKVDLSLIFESCLWKCTLFYCHSFSFIKHLREMSLKMYTFCTVIHCQQHKCWFCCPLTIPLTFQSTFFLKLHWVLWCHDTTCRLFYPSVFSVYLKRQSWVGNFCSFWERPCRLIWCPVGGLIGGCGARAVSRKTPIYFIPHSQTAPILLN